MENFNFTKSGFFLNPDISAVQDERLRFYGHDKSVLLGKAREVDFSDPAFNLSSRGKFRIKTPEVSFDCIFFPSDTKKIFVSLSSGSGYGKRRPYPFFTRWSYHNLFDGMFICVEDPMFQRYPRGGTMWFFGEKNHSYVYPLRDILLALCQKNDVPVSELYIFGSSMGGSIAIMLGNLIRGSNVFAMNAQYDPSLFNAARTRFFKNKFGVDLDDKTMNNFQFLPAAPETLYYIMSNTESRIDLRQQKYFSEKMGIPIEYGVHQYGNIVLWNHASSTSHSTFPEKLFFQIVFWHIGILKKSGDISSIHDLNILFSECLHWKYGWLSTIEDLQNRLRKGNGGEKPAKTEAEGLAGLKKENRRLRTRLQKLETRIEKERSSASWHIGRAITWIPRTLMRLLRR